MIKRLTRLIGEKRYSADELTPFSPEELQEVATAFAARCKASVKELALPTSGTDIDFSNLTFEQDAFFAGYVFSRFSCFRSTVFSGDAYFRGAAFSVLASFDGAAFFGATIFDGVFFSARAVAYFHGARFSRGAAFGDAIFSNDAIFDRAVFSLNAFFKGTAFFDQASFFGTTFSGEADFDGAAFSAGGANFNGTAFCDKASFFGAIFSGIASFSRANLDEKIIFTRFGGRTSFVNAEMNAETSFEGAIFEKEPPRFFGAKLHQGTVWRGIKWPLPKNKNEAGEFIDAYACLKLEMDRLKKHEDELYFFALELQSRRVSLGWRGFPFALYELLSNYGRSYVRPLVALCVVAAIGAGAFSYFDARPFGEALGLSAANTLNVFGLLKVFNLVIDTPLACLNVFAAVQTIFGTILLFLVGLGIRNKFRMK